MERSKTKRNSRILSWITGTDRNSRADAALANGEEQHPRRSSFLPSLLDHQWIDPIPSKQPEPAPCAVVGTRPPPFFHSRPLESTHYKHSGEKLAELSLCSLSSAEIATWKRSSFISGERSISYGRFGSLKSFLRSDKIGPATSMAPNQDDSRGSLVPDVDDYFCTIWPGMSSKSPIFYDHPFATPDLTIASRSSTRALDPNILSPPPPPPQPKHASVDPDYVMVPRQVKKPTGQCSPGIDPAKWAEMSVSAAELVHHFGRDNVVFGAAPPICPSDDEEPDEEEELPGDLSFFEMDDECVPLQSSSYNALNNTQNKSQEMDRSAAVSSMAGSIISLSKWPLPPHYERFEPARVGN